jgi:hypothetical protein
VPSQHGGPSKRPGCRDPITIVPSECTYDVTN